ncbi:hypothetical protein Tco_0484072 [Tanacetum coccineum]
MIDRMSRSKSMSDLWVEGVISVKGVSWVGDGGVSGVSLSVVSSADDKNGEIAGNGGIWSDTRSLDGSDSVSDAGKDIAKITRKEPKTRQKRTRDGTSTQELDV